MLRWLDAREVPREEPDERLVATDQQLVDVLQAAALHRGSELA